MLIFAIRLYNHSVTGSENHEGVARMNTHMLRRNRVNFHLKSEQLIVLSRAIDNL